MYKAIINPRTTDKTEMVTDKSTRPLKDDDHFLAVSTGITNKAPISKPPIVLIPTQTTIAKIQK